MNQEGTDFMIQKSGEPSGLTSLGFEGDQYVFWTKKLDKVSVKFWEELNSKVRAEFWQWSSKLSCPEWNEGQLINLGLQQLQKQNKQKIPQNNNKTKPTTKKKKMPKVEYHLVVIGLFL